MFKLFFKLILVLVIAAILTAGYLGFVPGLSTIMGADKPKDLGITYTQDDFGFIPQIYKGWRAKRLDGLSYLMLGFLCAGMFLWIIYGFSEMT